MESWSSAGSLTPLDVEGPVNVGFDRFDDAWIDRPIIERFETIALRYADRTALTDKGNSLRYREVRSRAYTLARRIDAVAPYGRPIGILMPHNAFFPVAALACLAAGRPFVPIDLKYPAARINSIIEEGGLAAVILECETEATRQLSPEIPLLHFDVASQECDEPVASTASAADVAVILYTSGSTGKPKGICNDQRAILQRVAEYTNSCHVNSDDRFILLSSPGTIAGEREIFTALLNGASLHVTDPQQEGISSVLNAMAERRITIGYAVPSLLRMLLRLPGAQQAFAHLRVMRVGGDITLDSDLRLFRNVAPPSCHFFASFSSTETPAVFQWFVPAQWEPTGARVPIGYPRPGIDFMAVDEHDQPVPEGELGELVVRSRYLALGQWQEGRLSAGPFRTDPADASLRILRTGDMVKQRADGLWELVGRKDRMVKIRGLRIDAGEVEAALRSCAGVTDAAVIPRRSGEEITALVAFVAPPDPQLLASLKQALTVRVPQYMHPTDIRLIDAIPQLPGFKPDMQALAQIDREQLQRDAAKNVAPTATPPAIANNNVARTRSEARIRNAVKYAWSVVLDAKSFEEDRPWNETGGDSLKALELWFYIEDRLGFKLPLDTMSENTTPSSLIATIRDHQGRLDQGTAEHSDVPVVFLLPGIQSDDPALARFRAAFGKNVRFKTVDYPGWRQTVADGGKFDAIADAVFKTICAEPVCDVYRLAGYSYGGLIAFEVARRLAASGRRVGFLGLLDTRRWDLMRENPTKGFHTFLGEPRRIPLDWIKWSIAELLRRRQFALIGMMERILMLKPSKISFWYKRQVTKELRYQALVGWSPSWIDVPTTLYLSNDRWPGEPEDYGWDSVCSRLTKVHVGGTHASVIQSPQREAICTTFLQAM